jgi:catechol 2,3-dioxygenase-like lactoylglutathione lyase family enzyme
MWQDRGVVTGRIHNVTFDCHRPKELVRFWSEVLGYTIQEAEENWASAVDPAGRGPRLLFQVVPEGKVAKNRMHLDVGVNDRGAEVERLLGLGSRRMRDVEEGGEAWTIMQDPEGNEFCLFEADEADRGQ